MPELPHDDVALALVCAFLIATGVYGWISGNSYLFFSPVSRAKAPILFWASIVVSVPFPVVVLGYLVFQDFVIRGGAAL